MLSRSRHDLDVDHLIDVRHVAADKRNVSLQVSMERLAEIILGMYGLDKPEEIGRSNWNVTLLSHKQVVYACVDAFVSFCLGRDLDAWDWNRYRYMYMYITFISLYLCVYVFVSICLRCVILLC